MKRCARPLFLSLCVLLTANGWADHKDRHVPLIGIQEESTTAVDHSCSYTGTTLTGSTHSINEFHLINENLGMWRETGTVPDLAEVDCPQQPVQIVERSIGYEPVGRNRAYHIRLSIKSNSNKIIGRWDVGGMHSPCYTIYRGLGSHRRQIASGEVDVIQCSILGDKYYDARSILEKDIDDAVVCRVVFLDIGGYKGRYESAWFNYDAPACEGLFAIDPSRFCKTATYQNNPYRRESDLCKSCTVRGGYWDCPQK